MSTFKWIKDKVPADLKISQVYAIVFSEDGKILLRIEDGKYQLTGGHPEENESFNDTVIREYIEEVNILIDEIYYLGYLLVDDENGNPNYAQVRMIGKIKNIGENRPDLDNGKIYKRYLSDISNVKKYLNYPGDAGNNMLDDAIKLALEKYKFKECMEERFI